VAGNMLRETLFVPARQLPNVDNLVRTAASIT
jgi:hypothetical protein